jgi:hypothetical protein
MNKELLVKELRQLRGDIIQLKNLKEFVIEENDLQKDINQMEIRIKEIEGLGIENAIEIKEIEMESQTVKKELKAKSNTPLVKRFSKEELLKLDIEQLVDLLLTTKEALKNSHNLLNTHGAKCRLQANYTILGLNKRNILEVLNIKRQ